MRLFERLARLLDNGRITLPDCDRIILAVDPAFVSSDRTAQIPYTHSDSFSEAHSLAMEQMAQLTELQIDLCIIDDPLCPRLSEGRREEIRQFAENAGIGDTTLGSQVLHSEDIAATIDGSNRVIINPVSHGHAGTSSPTRYDSQNHGINHDHFAVSYPRLQQKCRTCTYRNKDFDRPVEREHLNDLKCGINPDYAMSGAGDCIDFVEEPSTPRLRGSSVAQPPFDNIRVTGNCPFRISPALKRLLSPSSTSQYYCYRKLSYPSVSLLSAPPILEQLSTEITIPVECIELLVDGEPSGFYVKKISGDDWSITGEPFLPEVHRITELPQSEAQVNLGQLLFNAIQAIPGVVTAHIAMERFPDGWGYDIRVRTNDSRPLIYMIAPGDFNPETMQRAILFFRENIMWNV
jgi:hypothetical protein